MSITVDSESAHPDLAKVYDLDELGQAIHDNFREVKSLYNDANEEIFSLSNPNYENGESGKERDEDQLFGIFKKIRRKLIQINKLMKNYIDNYVVTEKVSTDFMQYMAQKSRDKAQEDDFSLSEILGFLEESSSTRDIQKHEQDLFVMCGMLNSFLLDKQFTLSDDKVASGYYQGTDGESLEQTSKNSIGLSNFIANFGKILRKRVIKGKPDSKIKRVMDTEPATVEDTDFELYKIPFDKKEQQALIDGEVDNQPLSDLDSASGDSARVGQSGLDQAKDPKLAEDQHLETFDKDLGDLISTEKKHAANMQLKETKSEGEQKSGVIEDQDQSMFSDATDQNEEFEPVLSKEELEAEHDKKMKKNEQFFENIEADRLEHKKELEIQLDASPTDQSQMLDDNSEIEAIPVDKSQDVEEASQPSTQTGLIVDGQSGQTQQDDTAKSQVSVLSAEKDKESEQSSAKSGEKSGDDLSSLLDSISTNNESTLQMPSSQASQANSIQTLEIQSELTESDNKSVGDQSVASDSAELDKDADEGSKGTNRKLVMSRRTRIYEQNQLDNVGLSAKAGDWETAPVASKMRLKQGRVKITKNKLKKKERKLNLASFLSRKHKRFSDARIFKKRSFLPKKELLSKEQKKKESVFHPIKYGYSDKGYISPSIIRKTNSSDFTHHFRQKKSKKQRQKLVRDSFSVYGKKKWYKPKIKVYDQERRPVPNDLYNDNPLINLI